MCACAALLALPSPPTQKALALLEALAASGRVTVRRFAFEDADIDISVESDGGIVVWRLALQVRWAVQGRAGRCGAVAVGRGGECESKRRLYLAEEPN